MCLADDENRHRQAEYKGIRGPTCTRHRSVPPETNSLSAGTPHRDLHIVCLSPGPLNVARNLLYRDICAYASQDISLGDCPVASAEDDASWAYAISTTPRRFDSRHYAPP